MKIVWREDPNLQPCAGHGISFYAGAPYRSAHLIAVVEGFEWLHGNPDVVELGVKVPGDGLSAEFLERARACIDEFIHERTVSPDRLEICDGVFIFVNG